MKRTVTRVLRELGIDPYLLGYGYMRDAIMMCLEDSRLLNKIIKGVYVGVAERNETTPTRVERAIRHAIHKAVKNAEVYEWSKYIGRAMETEGHIPNNGEFIAGIVDYILVFEEE